MRVKKGMMFTLLLFFLGNLTLQAQKKNKGEWLTMEIKTSAQCEMCKDKIESKLMESQGIRSANLNLSNQLLTVKYNSVKTTPETIRKLITGLGYDADELKADEEVYKKLPGCCKKPE